MDQEDNVGAATYDELMDETELTGVPGVPTILRAELMAMLVAIQNTETIRNLRIFSDSLTAIRLIRRWTYCPHELNEDSHTDVLDNIGQAIARHLGKVAYTKCAHTWEMRATRKRTRGRRKQRSESETTYHLRAHTYRRERGEHVRTDTRRVSRTPKGSQHQYANLNREG
eukprot:6995836-Pyramimonas_sp.AAC.1